MKIPSTFADLRGQTFKERVQVHELVAASARDIVFCGHDTVTNAEVVVRIVRPPKLHDDNTLARFEQRIKAARRVRHPVVALPIDSGELLDGKLYVISLRPPGRPLMRVLGGAPAKRLPLQIAAPLLLDLARGLAAIHARKSVHGAISPICCWVDLDARPRPSLVLLNTGSNIGPSTTEEEQGFSSTTVIGGDPLFIAPEAPGGLLGNARTDVYLLGVLGYAMLCGEPPFVGDNAFQVASRHMGTAVPTLRERGVDISPDVEAFVLALLAKPPDQRPSIAEVERSLLHFCGGVEGSSGEPAPPQAGLGAPPRGRGRRARGRAERAKASARGSSRAAAVQRLGGSARVSGQADAKVPRLPGQELLRAGTAMDGRVAAPRPQSPLQASVAPPRPNPRPSQPPAPSHAAVDEADKTVALNRAEIRRSAADNAVPVARPHEGATPRSAMAPPHEPLLGPEGTLALNGAALEALRGGVAATQAFDASRFRQEGASAAATGASAHPEAVATTEKLAGYGTALQSAPLRSPPQFSSNAIPPPDPALPPGTEFLSRGEMLQAISNENSVPRAQTAAPVAVQPPPYQRPSPQQQFGAPAPQVPAAKSGTLWWVLVVLFTVAVGVTAGLMLGR